MGISSIKPEPTEHNLSKIGAVGAGGSNASYFPAQKAVFGIPCSESGRAARTRRQVRAGKV